MGESAYLMSAPFPHEPRSEADWDAVREHPGREFEVKYHVPLYWLAMFEPGERGGTFLTRPVDDALATLERRQPNLVRSVGHADLLARFIALLRAEYRDHVVLRFGRFGWIHDKVAIAAMLDERALTPDELAQLAFDAHSEHVVGLLSGHASGWPEDVKPVRTDVAPAYRDTPVGRFLASPSDTALWTTCAAYLRVTSDVRAAILETAPFEYVHEHRAELLGPLADVVSPYTLELEGGFVVGVELHAPEGMDDNRPFLAKLDAALLDHPLWRTVRSLRGLDADVIRCATHPNFVSLRHISIELAGLTALSRATAPLRIRSVTAGGNFGVPIHERARWAEVLRVGALRELTDLALNLRHAESRRVFAPAELAWLLDAPLGRQLRQITLGTNGTQQFDPAAWVAALKAHPTLERVWWLASREPTIWCRVERSGATRVTGDSAMQPP